MFSKKAMVYIIVPILLSVSLVLGNKDLANAEIVNKINPLEMDDFTIRGITKGELLKKDLLSKLGKLIQIKTININSDRIEKYYIYSDLTIETIFVREENYEIIFGIEITKNNIKTKRGVTLGDNAEKVIEKYGPCKLDNGYYFYDTLLDVGSEQPDSFTIRFKIYNNKVTEIKIF
jgi:hypothetical protein